MYLPVKNDAREGGNFSIIMAVGDDKIPHTGTYLTIKRPTELTFSWQSPFSTDASQVTLLLRAISADTTQIELTHIKFVDEESRSNHEGGWRNILEELEKTCAAD